MSEDERDKLITDIYDAVVGKPNEPGLFERVRLLERAHATRLKLLWVILAASVGALAKSLFL